MRSPCLRSAVLATMAGISLPACSNPECGEHEIKIADTCYPRPRKDAGASCDAGECETDGGAEADDRLDASGSGRSDASSARADAAPSSPDGDAASAAPDPDTRDAQTTPETMTPKADAAPDTAAPGATCPADACGPGGTCSASDGDWSCTCAEGFRGTGTKSCVDIDECAERNVCTHASWPCVQTGPGSYTCQGRFAEWPIADSTVPSAPKPRFTVTEETVLDENTGLMWQRKIPPEYEGCTCSREGCGSMQGLWCRHSEARAYCDRLALAGHDDWRLPGLAEFESILDFGLFNEAVGRWERDMSVLVSIFDLEAFPSRSPGAIDEQGLLWATIDSRWNSLPMAGITAYSRSGSDSERKMVRCVRTDQREDNRRPESRFSIDAAKNVVVDTWTGLRWERVLGSSLPSNYSGAHARCQNLGMRLPTRKELQSLVDPAMIGTNFKGPTIDADAFPDTPSAPFWTSTSIPALVLEPVGNLLNFYVVDFLDGSVEGTSAGTEQLARCLGR